MFNLQSLVIQYALLFHSKALDRRSIQLSLAPAGIPNEVCFGDQLSLNQFPFQFDAIPLLLVLHLLLENSLF